VTRFYRSLLTLYPSRFHAEYREEMCRAFAERSRGHSRLAAILMAIADVVPNAIAAHWDILRHGAAAGTTVPAFTGDVRFALRQIARAPLLSGVIIGVIALGIGINAGLLTVLNTYAWRPAPGIPQDAALARLTPTAVRTGSSRTFTVGLSYAEILKLRARRDLFSEVAAWASTPLAADLAGGAEETFVSYTTANFFRMLRVTLAAGSGFPDDLEQSNAPVAIIGHSLWMTRFGGSPDAIGKTIRVMNIPFTIVGVAPPLFTGVDAMNMGRPTIWLPLGASSMLERTASDDLMGRATTSLRSVARLAPGVSPGDVDRMTGALAAQFAQTKPDERRRLSIRAERLTGIAQSDHNRTELVAAFLLVAVFVIVITCTNVSALLLGRAAARRREIGVRLALGATRLRLIRQMLTESLVHAVAGALLGLALYIPTIKIAYAMMPEIVYGLEPEAATFLFASLFAFATTFAFGLVPALHATSADIGEVMKNSGNHAVRRSRLQMMFVVIQLACSQPVLVVTSLVLADIRRGANENADQAPASVVTMSSRLYRPESARGTGARPRDADARMSPDVLVAVRRRLVTVPGVRSVAIGTEGIVDPWAGGSRNTPRIIRHAGVASFDASRGSSSDISEHVKQLYISADYFMTFGVPIVRGRTIGVDDDHRGSSVVVVNEAAAELLWPGEDPIGKRLVRRADGDAGAETPLEVIGVAGTAAYDKERGAPTVFATLSTAPSGWESTIAVQTSGDARAHVPRIRAAIREVEPYVAIGDVTTLAERYAGQRREALLSNAAAFAIGIAALVLASLGLYAIIAFAVAQRTREIGIRLAIGATTNRVVRHFFRDGIIVSAVGLAIGLPLTVAGIRVVQANLLGFTLENVAAVMVVVPVLVSVAALASWLPARRAGRVDPVIALRSE
jgi:predicted permease